MINLKSVVRELKSRDNFILCGHIDPDGDCIGSLFALKWALEGLDKNCIVLLTEPFRDEFSFLDVNDQEYKVISSFSLEELGWSSYTFVALDASDLDRLGEVASLTNDFDLINIDHHQDNSQFGVFNWVDSTMAAVGMMIYEILQKLELKIETKIGRALATAIIADTGAFRYENTSSRVLRVIADLMDDDVQIYEITRKLFSQDSFQATLLKGLAISTLKRSDCGKIAWLYIDRDMFSRAGIEEAKSYDVVNYARDIKGVEVGISFTEKEENLIKVSFRSNKNCPVNEIAAKFGGGGHPRAAGCEIETCLNQARASVIAEVKRYVTD